MDAAAARRPCFIEENDGLASLADMEAGVSGKQCHAFVSRRPLCSARSGFRNVLSSPRSSSRFYDARSEDHQPHFLDSCSLCKKPLMSNRDIFMYRGDTPFCSVDCRQEQIEMDEAKEKNWNLSSSMKARRKKKEQRKSTSPTKAQDYSFHAGTVAAA